MNGRDRILREGGITKLWCMKSAEKTHLTPLKKRVKGGNFRK